MGVARALTVAVPLSWERSSSMLLLAAVIVRAPYSGSGPDWSRRSWALP